MPKRAKLLQIILKYFDLGELLGISSGGFFLFFFYLEPASAYIAFVYLLKKGVCHLFKV